MIWMIWWYSNRILCSFNILDLNLNNTLHLTFNYYKFDEILTCLLKYYIKDYAIMYNLLINWILLLKYAFSYKESSYIYCCMLMLK